MLPPYRYKLMGKLAIPAGDDLLAWGRWLEKADRRVAETTIGPVWVSTVFVGLDMNFNPEDPLLFETMVFMGKESQEQDRYGSWDEAEKGHAALVEKYRKKVADIEEVTTWFARTEADKGKE